MARNAKRFDYERSLFATGIFDVAGVDEAGRGPLAGPVVAAAVILPRNWIEKGMPKKLKGVNDSKQLTALQREELYLLITAQAEVRFAVAKVEVEMIDQINILQATHRAMNAALAQLTPPPQHVLVDGLPVASMTLPNTAVVDGDALSYSIAAASIIAKVTRDRLMLAYHLQYPDYGFAEHKGYGTPQHLAALTQFGPCPIHRRTFAPIRPAQTGFFPEME